MHKLRKRGKKLLVDCEEIGKRRERVIKKEMMSRFNLKNLLD